MKLLFVRHGDPDYSIDSLTEKGWREAELLSRRLAANPADYYYVSPMGRAKDTAAATLKKLGRDAVECPWLHEFDRVRIWRPDVTERRRIAWDWLPQDWTAEPVFFREDLWPTQERMAEGGVGEEYDRVTAQLDVLLQEHGYTREGRLYRAERANNETLVFFCHFAVQCVLLSHLLNLPLVPLWQGSCAAPTSVTTVVTEERRKGIAAFRMLSFGDLSHLYCAEEAPAFSGRFCECYDNAEERHD